MDAAPQTPGPKHVFVLPPNLEGQAPPLRPGRKRTRELPIAPSPTAPGTPQSAAAPGLGTVVLNPGVPVMMAVPGASTSGVGAALFVPAVVAPASAALPAPVSRFTQRNRQRRALEEESGVQKRKYTRTVSYNTCSKCGQPKTAEYGHSRYGSATFCLHVSEGQTLEEWKRQQKPP